MNGTANFFLFKALKNGLHRSLRRSDHFFEKITNLILFLMNFLKIFFLKCLFFLFLGNCVFSQTKTMLDTIITPNSDGRFTLGTRNFRLMYGYPYPYSTSHFIININNKLATNRPYLKNITYLKGDLKSYFIQGIPASHITFTFEGFRIIQKLIPVDRYLDELQKKALPQYYRVEYEIENLDYQDKTKKRLAMLMLFDTQIADNDACIMQTCDFDNIRKGKNFLEKILSLFSFGSQKKERLYKDKDTPEVVLVFKSDKRHKDITGAFVLQEKQATKPDEVLIGRWQFYKTMRWAYADPNDKNIEYDDSALILKWKEREAKPFQKHFFATYYGVLDLDTLKMQNTKPLEKIETNFRVVPDTIYVGDTAKLVWETKNPIKAEIFISGFKQKFQNKGFVNVNPTKSQTYTLRLMLQGKEIELKDDFLTVLPQGDKPKLKNKAPQPPKGEEKDPKGGDNKGENSGFPNKKSKELDKKLDGRFTLGNVNTRNINQNSMQQNVTFGFPFQFSTSHFVLKINEKSASNYEHLGKNYHYLAGHLSTQTQKGSPKTQVIYEFEGVEIIQKLVPMQKKKAKESLKNKENKENFEEAKNNDFGQYYLVEYTFKNKSTHSKDIYFAQMFDVMMQEKDNAKVFFGEKEILFNEKFLLNNTEKNIVLAKNNLEEEENIALIFNEFFEKKYQKPAEAYVGMWQHLHQAEYDILQKPVIFTDDVALHLKWDKKTLLPKENFIIGFLIGNPKAKMVAQHHQKKPNVQNDVFFELNKYELTKKSIETLGKMLKNTEKTETKNYEYLVIEGFTDKIGTPKQNYELSQKRVQSVKDFLVKNGIEPNKILIKSHGQYFSGKKSDQEERKVSVMGF